MTHDEFKDIATRIVRKFDEGSVAGFEVIGPTPTEGIRLTYKGQPFEISWNAADRLMVETMRSQALRSLKSLPDEVAWA